MKYLAYDIYRHGAAGLSSLIMSLELAVGLSHLLDRVLVLVGNEAPSANLVAYSKLPNKVSPSLVTDLLDLPVPWGDVRQIDLKAFESQDLISIPLHNGLFYYPANIDTESAEFRAFSGRRFERFTCPEALQEVPVLKVTGGPNASTSCFYSYFFYLDEPTKRSLHAKLRQLKPKPAYASLAARVASALGCFNAVHIRRGDFKKTPGVSTLDRKPQEVLYALEPHFDRNDCLIILTDESDDPFFREICGAYPNHIFIDHFILENYFEEFVTLPHHDGIALAYLSQLVAAESMDFVGTMTSTFTALIQRARGNRGKDEPFKFLWNELPDPGTAIEPGTHPASTCVPLSEGIMVEQRNGSFSWNRFNRRINPAWQREWPESFLLDSSNQNPEKRKSEALNAGSTDASAISRASKLDETLASVQHAVPNLSIGFGREQIAFTSDRYDTEWEMAKLFSHMLVTSNENPLTEFRIEKQAGREHLLMNGQTIAHAEAAHLLLPRFKHEVAQQFLTANQSLIWLHAAAAGFAGHSVAVPGPWGSGKSSVAIALCDLSWTYLSDDLAPFDALSATVYPYPQTPQAHYPAEPALSSEQLGTVAKISVELDASEICRRPLPLKMIVFPIYDATSPVRISRCSKAEALAGLLENCMSFVLHREKALAGISKLLQRLPVYRLTYSNPQEAAELLHEFFVAEATLSHPRHVLNR